MSSNFLPVYDVCQTTPIFAARAFFAASVFVGIAYIIVFGWNVRYGLPFIFFVFKSPGPNKKSPCITPLIPMFGKYLSAAFNFVLRSPEVSSSISLLDLYTFGVALKIPFFATKNAPSRGSVPAKTAGAPSHLTVQIVTGKQN